MSMKFPPNPTRGSLMTYGGKTWRFDGSVWLRIDKNRGGQRGAVGPQGPAGPTGAAGASGIVGSYISSLNGLTGGINTIGLTFPFAGISTDGITVGILGITIDGAISFSGTTGDIKNPSSGSAKIDISVGSDDFTLGRFARTNGIVTIGDVDQVSNGTRIEVNGKNEKVDVYADQKIHLHNGVLFPESGISLGVGLTFPDGTFQSSAHAPHEFVSSFNGATGAVEGVNSFNGLTGAVTTTDLTLQVAGISASGGITIGGNIIDHTGTVGISGGLSITGDGNFNFVGDNFSITGGSSTSKFTVKVLDDISFIGGNTHDFIVDSDFNGTLTGQVKVRTDKGEFFRIASSSVGPSSVKFGDLDSLNSDTQINVSSSQTDGVTGNIFIETNGTIRETFNENYRRNTDVATFTINASSSIATGAKTNSLYRIPYDATLTNFDVKASAIGGLTAAIRIAGPDFGDPLTSGITGCSLGVEGLTGSSTVFDQASVTAGNFVLLDIFSNNSGSTGTQAFLTFESR